MLTPTASANDTRRPSFRPTPVGAQPHRGPQPLCALPWPQAAEVAVGQGHPPHTCTLGAAHLCPVFRSLEPSASPPHLPPRPPPPPASVPPVPPQSPGSGMLSLCILSDGPPCCGVDGVQGLPSLLGPQGTNWPRAGGLPAQVMLLGLRLPQSLRPTRGCLSLRFKSWTSPAT